MPCQLTLQLLLDDIELSSEGREGIESSFLAKYAKAKSHLGTCKKCMPLSLFRTAFDSAASIASTEDDFRVNLKDSIQKVN